MVNRSKMENKGPCALCGKKREDMENNEFFPFCSEKCKNIDLYHWLNGDYCIYEELPKKEENK